MNKTIHIPTDAAALDRAAVGGKAANLARLAGVPGVNVPAWFAVGAGVFRRHLDRNGLRDRLRDTLAPVSTDDPAALAAAAERVRSEIVAVDLPGEDAAAIRAALAETFPADAFLSVRSSALAEDCARQSFAGQLDSYLFVRGADDVLDAVRRCFASGFSERAVTYRLLNSLPVDDVAVAVVVQRMIDAEVSGVLFTADPVTNDRGRMSVNAAWGLGEGVVQGIFETDLYGMARDGASESDAQVGRKTQAIRFDLARGAGTASVAVKPERVEARCLDDLALERLRRAGVAVEQAFGRPQDIEFAFAGGELYILQARAITTLPPGPEDGAQRIWDNSNIIESYCGVTTPLTFSFVRHAYAIVYDQFLEIMGVPARVRRANQAVFDNMLGLIHGCVYYNLRNWYALIRFLPGYRWNREFMETMMGVRESWSEETDEPPASAWERYGVELPRMAALGARCLWNFQTVDRRMRRFLRDFEETWQSKRRLDLDALTADALLELYEELEARVLRRWKPPILSDFFAMIFYGTLKKLIVAWGIDDTGALQNDLLCGEDVASAEPPKMLLRIAAALRGDARLLALIREHDPGELAAAWHNGAFAGDAGRHIERYLDLYGDRSMNELKLEEPSLREEPAFLFRMLKNYVTAGDPVSTEELGRRERDVRAGAEARAEAALGTRRTKLGLRRATLFRWVLKHARANVRNRENQRFARTRIFGLVRQVFLALGRRLADEGALRDANDIFYLDVEEVFRFVRGTATSVKLQELCDLRRAEFDAWRAAPPLPERFTTYGMVYVRNRFEAEAGTAPNDVPEGCLKGVPCCGGVVTGTVKKILSPADDMTLDGEILVAEKTDPGWIPLYPSVSGILIERGSVLSHSAIVAREMGKPTIVGIPGLTAALASGDEVEMDGATGLVRPQCG